MTTDDLAAIILCLVGATAFALVYYGDRENYRLEEEAQLRQEAEHQARIHTIAYGRPRLVRRPPLTEEEIVNRAAEKGGAPKGTNTRKPT